MGGIIRYQCISGTVCLFLSFFTFCQASSSFPSWDRNSCQGNRRSCLLGWINSLEETTRRTLFIHHLPVEICDPVKDMSLFSCEAEFCRICHCGKEDEELIAPCRCSGSAKFAHQSCLLSWFELKKDKTCELCLYEISVKKMGFKPFSQVLKAIFKASFHRGY